MARRKAPVIPDELLDQLLAGRDPQAALGKDGLIDALKRALTERALNAAMDHHLEGEAAEGRPNSRNGYGRKTLLTDGGKLPIAIPRDRLSTFDPQLIAKYRRRLPGFDAKIVSMYARGMTAREIQGHPADLYGLDVPPNLVSAVTDAVLDEISAWQNRPLEELYPLVFFDALRVKVRDEGTVRNKAVYLALGVRADGRQEILGLLDRADRGCQVLAAGDERAQGSKRSFGPASRTSSSRSSMASRASPTRSRRSSRRLRCRPAWSISFGTRSPLCPARTARPSRRLRGRSTKPRMPRPAPPLWMLLPPALGA